MTDRVNEMRESDGGSIKRPREEIDNEEIANLAVESEGSDTREENIKRARLSHVTKSLNSNAVDGSTKDTPIRPEFRSHNPSPPQPSLSVVETTRDYDASLLPSKEAAEIVTDHRPSNSPLLSSMEVVEASKDYRPFHALVPNVVVNDTNIVPSDASPIPFSDPKLDQSLSIFCDSFYNILQSLIQHYKYATIRILVYYHEVLKIYMEYMFRPQATHYTYEWYQQMIQLLFGVLPNGKDLIQQLQEIFAAHQVYPLYYCLHHCIEHLKPFDVVAASVEREAFEHKVKDQITDALVLEELFHQLQLLQTNQENHSLENQLILLENIRKMIGKTELTTDLFYLYRIRFQPIQSPQQDYILTFGRLVIQVSSIHSKRLEEIVALLTQITLPESAAPENILSPMPISKPAPKKLSVLDPPKIESSNNVSEKPTEVLSIETAVKDIISTDTKPLPLPAMSITSSNIPAIAPPDTLPSAGNNAPSSTTSTPISTVTRKEALWSWCQTHFIDKTEDNFKKMKYHLQELYRICLQLGKPDLKEYLSSFDRHLYSVGSFIDPSSNTALLDLLRELIPNFQAAYLFFNQLAIEIQHAQRQLHLPPPQQQTYPQQLPMPVPPQQLLPPNPQQQWQHLPQMRPPSLFPQALIAGVPMTLPGIPPIGHLPNIPPPPLPSTSFGRSSASGGQPFIVQHTDMSTVARVCDEVVKTYGFQNCGIDHQALLSLLIYNADIDLSLIQRYASYYKVNFPSFAVLVHQAVQRLGSPDVSVRNLSASDFNSNTVAMVQAVQNTGSVARPEAMQTEVIGNDQLRTSPPTAIKTSSEPHQKQIRTSSQAQQLESKPREVIDLSSTDVEKNKDRKEKQSKVVSKSIVDSNVTQTAKSQSQREMPISEKQLKAPEVVDSIALNKTESSVGKEAVEASHSAINPLAPPQPLSPAPAPTPAPASTSSASGIPGAETTSIIISMRDSTNGNRETKFRINNDRKLAKLIKTFCTNISNTEVNRLVFEYKGRIFEGNDFSRRLAELGFHDNDVVLVKQRESIG